MVVERQPLLSVGHRELEQQKPEEQLKRAQQRLAFPLEQE
jgi:hypothetical protein